MNCCPVQKQTKERDLVLHNTIILNNILLNIMALHQQVRGINKRIIMISWTWRDAGRRPTRGQTDRRGMRGGRCGAEGPRSRTGRRRCSRTAS